jgi:hypothetical protein
MKRILRIYLYLNGKEQCISDPVEIAKHLSTATESIDLDWADSRGHAKIATSADLAGETVKVGEQEVEIPQH